ncbi:hypothetical protein OAM67_00770 [bacterium]|jgi:anthranilate/para-aminobenzoate synthase component II|nr:hypothetical protein [bacterium]
MSFERLLIVQNCNCGECTFFKKLVRHVEKHTTFDIIIVDARKLPRVLPPFDGVVIAGSNHNLHESPNLTAACVRLFNTAATRHKPLFAICFGFQAMIFWLTGQKSKPGSPVDKQIAICNVGFECMPRKFAGYAKHSCYVQVNEDDLPLNCNVVCRTNATSQTIQAIRLTGLPFVGTAFHPEACQSTWPILADFYSNVVKQKKKLVRRQLLSTGEQ